MRIAILYGTKYGFTKDVAVKIRKSLGDHIAIYNLREETPMLDDYEGFVIGSSIYMGSCRKEVKEFISVNKKLLKDKNLWFFTSCANREEYENLATKAYSEELFNRSILNVNVGHHLNKEKMNMFDKLVMRMVSKGQSLDAGQMDELAVEMLINSIKGYIENANVE